MSVTAHTPGLSPATGTPGGAIGQFARGCRRGVSDTSILLAARWHNFRVGTRVGIILAGLAALVFLLLAANLGYGIKVAAVRQPDSAAGIFALSWILSLQRGELGGIGTITLGATLLAAIVAPFTGSSTLSTSPPEDTHTLRPARLHRYYESWLINAFSGIGLLQIFALTAVASILTIEGGRPPVMVFAWCAWLMLVSLTTTIGWSLELAARTWGKRSRFVLAGACLTVGGALAWWDVSEPRFSFLSVGNVYAQWAESVTGSARDYLPAAGALTLAGTLLIAGLYATWRAQSRPLPVTTPSRRRKPLPLPTGPISATTRLVLTTLWRTPESRRPIAAIIILGTPSMVLFTFNSNIESALMLAVPAALSLAWGVNIFGLFGPGMPWLASTPRVLTLLPRVAAATQFMLTVTLVWSLWFISYLAGNTNQSTGQRLLIGSLVAGSLSTALSTYLSIQYPVRARLTGRGDALTPPLTTLTYLGVLVVVACLPAIIVVGTLEPPWQTPTAAALTVIATAIWLYSIREWSKPSVRARAAAVTGA